MSFNEVETGLKVGDHPGGNKGTAYRLILTTSGPYPGAYVGEALKEYARVFAAAPDLLEAAKHAVMEWRLHGSLTDSARVLEAAIAKATKGE